jgi:hypothetical protein
MTTDNFHGIDRLVGLSRLDPSPQTRRRKRADEVARGVESLMDRRIESFLGDVLALAGEEPDAVWEGVRVALAKGEAIFRLQEPKKRMRDQAAHACRALCRARVAEELHRRRGTRIGEHLAGAQRHRSAGAMR